MISTESWLTYADLDLALKQIGYSRDDYPDARIYRHPAEENAILTFPPIAWDEPVRTYHYATTRKIVDDFGVSDSHAFDLLLVRITHKAPESALVI